MLDFIWVPFGTAVVKGLWAAHRFLDDPVNFAWCVAGMSAATWGFIFYKAVSRSKQRRRRVRLGWEVQGEPGDKEVKAFLKFFEVGAFVLFMFCLVFSLAH